MTMISFKKVCIKAVSTLVLLLMLMLQAYPAAYVYANEGEPSSPSESSSNESESDSVESDENNSDDTEEESDGSEDESEDQEIQEGATNSESDDEENIHAHENDDSNNTDANVNTESIDLTNATSTTDEDVLEDVQEILENTIDVLEDTEDDVSELTSTTTSTTTGPIIQSGTSVAMANILNIVNTSVVNSTGAIVFANLLDGSAGDIDLRDDAGTSTGRCVIFNCGSDVNLNMLSDAHINNLINVSAVSGDNGIINGDNPEIHSGDAYAGVNLVNVANTNIINSNYLLVTLNAFRGVRGDIVFPSLSDFFQNLASAPIGDVEFHGQANVTNNVSTNAESGENTVSNANQSTVTTGNAHSSSNVFNQINSNFIGGGNVSILFRVHGNWVGDIFGAPDSMGWTRGEDGSIFLFDTQSGAAGLAGEGETNVYGTSTVDINNNVAVVALTGENEIDGAHAALITTGNAYAGSNVVNIANSNIIGRNWMLAIVNIFGDFEGNIAFGRPDLWVGEQVTVPSSIRNGGEITYKHTVINNGDSPATRIKLKDSIDAEHLDIISSSLAYIEESDGDIEWAIESLSAGAATEITYTARVRNAGYETDITNTVSVQARETDNNTQDNSDTATITTDGRSSSENTVRVIKIHEDEEDEEELIEPMETLTDISIKREIKEIVLEGSDRLAHESIVLKNKSSNAVHSVVVHDVLRDEDGKIVQDEVWDLGTVLAREEIDIAYDIAFASYAKEGTYTLSTKVISGSKSAVFENNGSIIIAPAPVPATEDVSIMNNEDVRGASTTVGAFTEVISNLLPTAEAGETDAPVGNIAAAGYYGFKTYAYVVAILCFGLVLSLIFGTDIYYQLRKR